MRQRADAFGQVRRPACVHRDLLRDSAVTLAAMPLRDDNPSEVDLLGFEDVVDILESIVIRPDLDPFTVGVSSK